MCEFTYTHLECGHRKQDHIDTSLCAYFERTGVHCQPDNRQHKERGTTVVTRKRKGRCFDCLQEAENADLAAAIKESIEASERDKRAREEAERVRREEDERIEWERKAWKQHEEAKLAERRRREEAETIKNNAAAAAERRAREAAELQAQMEKEQQDLLDRIAREEAEEAAELERKKDAEHKERLRLQKAEHDRKLAEKANEARRLREAARKAQEVADEQIRYNREVGIEHQHEADEDRVEREKEELNRKLAREKATEAAEAASPPPGNPTNLMPKTAVDYSTLVGHHGHQEIGHGMLGNRRIPLHESQKRAEPTKPSTTPGFKPAPSPMASLARPVQSSPTDYRIPQPSLTALPGTTTPDWKKNIHPRSGSNIMPAAELSGPTSELELRLAKRRAWEAEQEKIEAEKTNQERSEPGWHTVNKAPNSAAAPSKPTSAAPQTPAISTSPPPTYPVVPPLAQPKMTSASPPRTIAIANPPVSVKRIPSASSPPSTSPIPTPPPMPSLPTRVRVDSAASSPRAGNKQNNEDDEWDEPDSHKIRKQFSPDDVFGEQRRKGWRVE
ncbi:hypothetical protein SLS60_006827 [Paraconiothyrium brasiliense]|uniref:Uncharacterized protein n=1 Tax=Paraconiothyrium brasiliense TaxID=300254 RepID=A0ABR3R7W1_9PLEO